MKYVLLLLTLIVNVSCLAQNDEEIDCAQVTISAQYDDCVKKNTLESNRQLEQLISRFEIHIGKSYQADQQLGRALIKTVLESQKAWISYRDKHCKIIAFEIEEGTAAYITTINSCAIELNEERMAQLSQLL
jgi:uncharacterized protein YecT (DUF1311 family)